MTRGCGEWLRVYSGRANVLRISNNMSIYILEGDLIEIELIQTGMSV